MIKLKAKPESECERIMAIVHEITAHQDRMLALIEEEAAKDKLSAPGLPLPMLIKDIAKHGHCPCSAALHRLDQTYRAAELAAKALAERQANG